MWTVTSAQLSLQQPSDVPEAAVAVLVVAPVALRSLSPTRTPAEEQQVLATWEVVAAAQGGDADAFGLLYDRYVDMVFRYVLFRVNDRCLAEDLTSETFLRALRRITSITYQGKDVGAWFVTIARNIVLDHVNRVGTAWSSAPRRSSTPTAPRTQRAMLLPPAWSPS